MTITGTSESIVTPVTPAAPVTPGTPAPDATPVPPVQVQPPVPAPQVAPVTPAHVPTPTQEPAAQTPPDATPPASVPAPVPAQPDNPLDAVYTPLHHDPTIQTVEGMLNEKGLTVRQVAEIFDKSVESGNPEDIDQAKLKEHLGESGAKLAMQGILQYHEKVKAERKKMHDTAVHLLGGEAQLDAFKTWVDAVPADVQDMVHEYVGAVNEGGHLGYLALDALKDLYHKHAAVPVGTRQIIAPDTQTPAGTTLEPFKDRRDYVNAMKAAQDSKDKSAIDLVTRRFMVKPV